MNRPALRRAMLLTALVGAFAVAYPAPSSAVVGALDQVPAATLLLPYFEVDLDNPNGPQTRFSVINTDAAPTLAKVTLWSDLGVPTFNFDVYLEGRDTVEVDLRMVFNGVLPQTGPNLISLGGESDPSQSFTGCSAGIDQALAVSLPVPDLLSAAQLSHLAAAHTGAASASLSGKCAGSDHGDHVARGYVTIDVVNECSALMPSDAGYLVSGGSGIAGNRNVLSGSFTLLDRSGGRRAASSPLVHLEADDVDAQTSTPGNYTFYSTFNNATASDNREPVGAVWQARQLSPALFAEGAELIVWRDPGRSNPTPFTCGTLPAPFPIGQIGVFAFDETEELFILNAPGGFPNPPQPLVTPFPYAAQRTAFAAFSPFEAGWSVLNLNDTTLPIAPGGVATGGVRQAMVLVRQSNGTNDGPFLPAVFSAGPLQMSSPTSCNDVDACNSFTPAVGYY